MPLGCADIADKSSSERLPYLGAVIKEGLRLSYGVSSRTARIATEEDLVYRGEWNKKDVEYVIPRGYGIGMSTVITHHAETIFPDSHRFLPERWLDDQNRLEKGFMAFGKGSRRCLASKYVTLSIMGSSQYAFANQPSLVWLSPSFISQLLHWLSAFGLA